MKYYIGKVPFGKDDNDSLTHYGRKGMKWGKNIFEDAVDTVRGATRTIGNATGNVARQISKTAGSVGSRVGKAAGNFVGNHITGSIPKAEAERQMRIGDIHARTAINADRNSRSTLAKQMTSRNITPAQRLDLMGRSNNANNYAQDKANQAREAYKKSANAERQYNRAFIPALRNELAGYASAGKAIGNAVGNVAGGAANAVGNWVGERVNDARGAANAVGDWVGDRARDVDRFVNTSITGKNFHDQADRLRSSGNQDAINVANQLDEIGNRSLLGRAGNLVNNIGNAVGGAGQWVGDRVNDANRFINTSITGKNFHDQANQIRENSNHPEAAAVADQLDEIGNRSLFGRIGNAVGQAGQWLGERASDVGNAVGGAANAVGGWAEDRVRDINDLAGQAGQAVGNVANGAGQWLGERASDVGNFVDQNITGNSARDEAGKHYINANNNDVAATEQYNRYKDLWIKAQAAQGPERKDLLDQAGQAYINAARSLHNRDQEESQAEAAKRRADNTLFGHVGNAVGNVENAVGLGSWLGNRARDAGDFVDRYITGDSAREKAEREREIAERERRNADIYDKTVKGYYNRGNPWISDDVESWDRFRDRQDKQWAYMDNARRNAHNADSNARKAEARAFTYQNEADNSLFGRAGNLANNIGNAVGQAGQAVGQTMSNIGDWGGEQLDRGKRILGRLFGRR